MKRYIVSRQSAREYWVWDTRDKGHADCYIGNGARDRAQARCDELNDQEPSGFTRECLECEGGFYQGEDVCEECGGTGRVSLSVGGRRVWLAALGVPEEWSLLPSREINARLLERVNGNG